MGSCPCHSKSCGVLTPLGTESYSCLPADPLLLVRVDIACSRRSDTGVLYEVGEREKKNKEDERAVTPNHTPSLFCCCCCCCCFLSAHISFPTKKKIHNFTACQQLLGFFKRNRLQNRSQYFFFLPFLRHHCEADLEHETRAMHGEQVLQAIKKNKNIK